VLLLDGLDEVVAETRSSCVESHPQTLENTVVRELPSAVAPRLYGVAAIETQAERRHFAFSR